MFSRKANLLRHMTSIHKTHYDNKEDENMDDEINYSENSSEEEISSESSDGDSSDDDEEETYWREIVDEAADNLEFDNAEELLNEPLLSAMVDEMRQVVEKKLEFADHMKNENEIYARILLAKKRYKDETDEIAAQTAWNDKRFVLKKVITENMDIFEESDTEEISNTEGDIEDSEADIL